MVAISRQYPFGADKAGCILDTDKKQNTLLIGYQILMPGSFGFKFSENFNFVLLSMHTQQEKCVLKFWLLKLTSKFEHENRK